MFQESSQSSSQYRTGQREEKGSTLQQCTHTPLRNEDMHKLFPTCHCYGLVIDAPVDVVWEEIKHFKLDRFYPNSITNMRWLVGNPCVVGAEFSVTHKDKKEMTFRIIEINEVKKKLGLLLIDSNPKLPFNSLMSCIRLMQINDENQTFIYKISLISGDVKKDFLEQKKEEERSCASELKNYFKNLSKSSA